jgi:hypothetical protein
MQGGSAEAGVKRGWGSLFGPDLADGEAVGEDVAALMRGLILPAFSDRAGAAEALSAAIAQRPQRSKAYL